ncbi:MAG: CPBP family intramembrane metalloprotease [Bacteroidales bacterium]|jgi:membrane protease YdiL (CAAX protease family)|nr:CPBP family intramembrane metalloprotease [Bacteroidales bacterium]
MVFEYYLSAAFVAGIVVLLYGLYYILAYSKIYDYIYAKFGADTNPTVFHSVFFRLTGFVLFGIFAYLIFCNGYGVEFDFLEIPPQHVSEIIGWSVVLGGFFVIVAYVNVRNSKSSHYPQFKINQWTLPHKITTYSTWALYIIAYEFMFRGILLFGTVEEVGYIISIVFNVFLYAFVHIPKGGKEVLGCLLLGPALCILALKTHSIAIPVFVHLSLCLSNEFFSVRAEELAQKRISSRL